MEARPIGRRMTEARAADCQALLAALHEAGHAVVMAALGLPIARAKARRGAGVVILDTDKARILVARRKRQRHGPAPHFATVAAQLCVMAGYLAGGRAVALREATRPQAAWQPFAAHYGRPSRGDWRGIYAATDRLYSLGRHGSPIAGLVEAWTDETLARHAPTVARVAAALLRRGLLTGPELDRLLAPLATDPEPTARMVALAQHVASDPGLAWPRPPPCGLPAPPRAPPLG
ncbi:MAG: hypothetical protein ING03_13250 [Roseomonas sp.]|nr:hypothetical protein [Roseomonas sp.]MCA3316980.1 hypothetical protein [Roseomonas sp.]MCA3321262.1 hypothetical protein [Roseomonas sp.]